MDKIKQAADLLIQVRDDGQPLPTLPADCFPADMAEAYAIQAQVIEQLLQRETARPVGYKIACTNKAAQEFLGLEGSFHAPLLSSRYFQSPASLKADDFFTRFVEPEFAFRLAQDLPPRAQPYSQAEVSAAIGVMLPAIEIVDSRYQDWTKVGALCLIADHAVHGCLITGQPTTAWTEVDLAQHEVEFWLNGELSQTGRGEVVLGHPLIALTWLANDLNAQGKGLQAGEVVTTGICIDGTYDAQAGDDLRADFGSLGLVEVQF